MEEQEAFFSGKEIIIIIFLKTDLATGIIIFCLSV